MRSSGNKFIIDFDSTFVSVEALDELCKLCYPDKNERSVILKEIREITNKGMNGDLSITTSLEVRLGLLKAHARHLDPLVEILRHKVSASFKRNKQFIRNHRESIFIVSNGFREFILPVVLDYGISPRNVFANTFEYDGEQNIIGFDRNNILARDQGKVKLVSKLRLNGNCIVVGDGYTDFEIKEAGLAKIFYAFTENIYRECVVGKTAYVAPSLDYIIKDLSETAIEESIILTL